MFRCIKKIPSNYVNLIYLDPPFFTQKEQILKSKQGVSYKFDDNWESIDSYISFLSERLSECKRVLKEDGTIFLHCDKKASHYIKVLLDNIFGYNNFINEIIWSYKRWSNNRNGLLNGHQNIFWYSKSNKYTFNPQYQNYSATTNIDQILLNRERNSFTNKTQYSNTLAKEKKGVLLSDVWEIPFFNPKAKERVNYPTQKPILLLEQIIKLASNKGDVVLDPFCGSGTTLVSAKLLERNYIGIDVSIEAIQLATFRLNNPIKTESNLLKNGKESYLTKENKKDILNKIGAKIVYRSAKADGILSLQNRGLIAVKIQDTGEDLWQSLDNLNSFIKNKKLQYGLIITQNDNAISYENKVIEFNRNIKLVSVNNIENIAKSFNI
ncbi:MAG: site-specific DNA-methyltransferase [Alphaproteobacteria bacterium]|nr:site-specific DNA-methyltransferase [Alphaproteobacteria bacterium]